MKIQSIDSFLNEPSTPNSSLAMVSAGLLVSSEWNFSCCKNQSRYSSIFCRQEPENIVLIWKHIAFICYSFRYGDVIFFSDNSTHIYVYNFIMLICQVKHFLFQNFIKLFINNLYFLPRLTTWLRSESVLKRF